MGTLVLEDLNLVSLHAMLKRLPKHTLVSDIMEIIGEREIFSEDQAKRIIKEMESRISNNARVNEVAPTPSMHDVIIDRSSAIQATRKSLTPSSSLSQTEEIYRVLNELHKRLSEGHDRKGKFPMHAVRHEKVDRWVNVEVTYGKRVKVFISQPDCGQAFWPRVELIDGLNDEQFLELLNRTRDWVYTEYQALGLKD